MVSGSSDYFGSSAHLSKIGMDGSDAGLSEDTPKKVKTPRSRKLPFGRKRTQDREFDFDAHNEDVLGVVVLEIKSATNLPKIRNMTRLSWDMDPFVVTSFGQKVFRTRVIRHNLNPVWDEKLYFRIRRGETGYNLSFAVFDWDNMTGNDFVGSLNFPVQDLINDSPQQSQQTGLYDVDDTLQMKDYEAVLNLQRDEQPADPPKLYYRALYTPYAALRQRFWRQNLKLYDTDDSQKVCDLHANLVARHLSN